MDKLMTEPVRLTQLAKRAGCAAKQPPGYLLPFLQKLPPILNPNVLVGTSTADDAAIYKLNDDLALVDNELPPIVDSPYDFGAVAASNAISDIYAMGETFNCPGIVRFRACCPRMCSSKYCRAGEKAKEAGSALSEDTVKSDSPSWRLSSGRFIPRDPSTTGRTTPYPDQTIRAGYYYNRREKR
jgi:selenide,water dikinase